MLGTRTCGVGHGGGTTFSVGILSRIILVKWCGGRHHNDVVKLGGGFGAPAGLLVFTSNPSFGAGDGI